MSSNNWDFSKLPEHEHKLAIKATNDGDATYLLRLHNKYKLSNYTYCCSYTASVLGWFRWAIKFKHIK